MRHAIEPYLHAVRGAAAEGWEIEGAPGWKCVGDWCGVTAELVEAVLQRLGVDATAYLPDFEGSGGVAIDGSHAYVVLDDGTIIDATIRQFLDSPRATVGQRAAAAGYPRVPGFPEIAVIPANHPFVCQMGYESHLSGHGWKRKPPWWSKRFRCESRQRRVNELRHRLNAGNPGVRPRSRPAPIPVDCNHWSIDARTYAEANAEAFWDFEPDEWRWRCVRYPIARLLAMKWMGDETRWSKEEWVSWLAAEVRDRVRDMGDDYYEQLERAWLGDPLYVGPVVIVESRGMFDIGDGWHRTAMAVEAGLDDFPAVLGTRRRRPHESPHESAAKRER